MPRLRPPASLLFAALSACTAPNPAFLVGSVSDGQTSGAETSSDSTALASTSSSGGGGSGGQTSSAATTDPTGDVSTTLPATSSTTAAPDMGVMSGGSGGGACGDGEIDPEEQCDLGPDNSDDGVCTSQCTSAFCGDGLVHAGVEQCDDGNVLDEDGCQADCTLLKIEKIVAGGTFTCALLSHGKVRCWGGNAHGQLGTGDIQSRGDQPGELPGPYVDLGESPVVDLAAGNEAACAVLADGAVRCWGRNESGQLGVGSTQTIGDDMGELPPAAVVLGVGAQDIAGGAGFFCARTADNRVRCWGNNTFGQIGRGVVNDNIGDAPLENLALDVNLGFDNVVGVFTGTLHACAVSITGALRCWGHGQSGKLGYDNQLNLGDNPGELPPMLGDVKFVGIVDAGGAGVAHTCARLSTKRVRCWGDGNFGKLATGGLGGIGGGNGFAGMNTLADLPFVAPAFDILQLAVGNQHACALVGGGVVRCWGANLEGQLGLGHISNIGDDPGELPLSTEVALGEPALAIYSGASAGHTCAVLKQGRVRCWGRNLSGQLGVGNTQPVGDNEKPLVDTPVLPGP